MTVEHQPDRHRFTVHLPEGDGRLLYREAGPGVLSYWHTEVDPGLQGLGVADALVHAAMDYARQSGLRVILDCPDVQACPKKHPEYLGVVAPA
jgi:hypothetical protein